MKTRDLGFFVLCIAFIGLYAHVEYSGWVLFISLLMLVC